LVIERVKDTELADQIAQLNVGLRERIAEAQLQGFAQAIRELVGSDVAKRAVTTGMRAPDFSLPDQTGRTVSLSTVLQRGPALVVFYRGEWCPYCDLTLRAYQRSLPDITRLGASLLAISPQTPDSSLSTAEKKHLSFFVLSDVGNVVARQYGLVFVVPELARHPGIPAANGDESWELPIPGSYVIGQDGDVKLAFVDPDWTRRLEPAAILKTLEDLRTA